MPPAHETLKNQDAGGWLASFASNRFLMRHESVDTKTNSIKKKFKNRKFDFFYFSKRCWR